MPGCDGGSSRCRWCRRVGAVAARAIAGRSCRAVAYQETWMPSRASTTDWLDEVEVHVALGARAALRASVQSAGQLVMRLVGPADPVAARVGERARRPRDLELHLLSGGDCVRLARRSRGAERRRPRRERRDRGVHVERGSALLYSRRLVGPRAGTPHVSARSIEQPTTVPPTRREDAHRLVVAAGRVGIDGPPGGLSRSRAGGTSGPKLRHATSGIAPVACRARRRSRLSSGLPACVALGADRAEVRERVARVAEVPRIGVARDRRRCSSTTSAV